jgi:hypothetical protein
MAEYVRLDNLGGGAAAELFEREMQKVLENIADPNTPYDKKREIALKVSILPNEERSLAAVEIGVSLKLPGTKPYQTYFSMGIENGQVVAKQPDVAVQHEMFDEKIVNLEGRKE